MPLSRSHAAFLAAAVVIVVALALGLTFALTRGGGSSSNPATSAAAANPDIDAGSPLNGVAAPNFSLTDQYGRAFSLHQLRGKVVLLAFVDSQCTTVCPISTSSMVEAQQLLGNAGSNLALVGVNANPLATTVADVHAYSVAHAMPTSWRFVTGSRSQLEAVWKAYHVASVVESGGGIDHEPVIYLIDSKGREQSLFITQMAYAGVQQQAQILADAAARFLPGHPAVPQAVSLEKIPSITPQTSISLPIVGGLAANHQISLGPGQTHLLVFFATWLSETSDLSKQMLALNQYQSAATATGLPGLVAVDESTTEPSPASLGNFLSQLPKSLAYPVVADAAGRLADGYGAQDAPWFVVTSSNGKILYTHDGWLSASAIVSAVRSKLSAPQ